MHNNNEDLTCKSGLEKNFALGSKSYCLTVYTARTEFLELQNDWELLERNSDAPFSYFQRFDWCDGFFDNFLTASQTDDSDGAGGKPMVFVLREANDRAPIMIWPMCLARTGYAINELVSFSHPLGQYSNILFDHDKFSAELGKKSLKAISELDIADAIVLDHYPKESSLADMVADQGFVEDQEHQSSILNLEKLESWEAFSATFSKNQRKQLNRRRRNLEGLGKLDFNVEFGGTDEFKNLVARCLEMKRRWLEETGRRKGILFDDRCITFFQELDHAKTDADHHTGAIAMALRLDGKPIAIELGFAASKDYYSYLGAIDLDYNKHSPGKLQIEEAQRWALKEGFRYFDFLNDPSAYKSGWTDMHIPLESRHIPLSSAGYLYCWLWKTSLRPRLKQFYHNAGARQRKVFSDVYQMLSKNKPAQ